jgi:squalene synthase HpnC
LSMQPTTSTPLREEKTPAGENFPVAMRLLPPRFRNDLLAVYRYARYVDNVGDEAAGDRRRALAEIAAVVQALYRGEAVKDPVVAGLASTVERCRLPADPLLALVQANVMDQDVHSYATFDELLGYCKYSANPVGEIVLHIFDCVSDNGLALSSRICTGLQLIEHWQDVGEDYAVGRIYLPQQDMARYRVKASDLGGVRASPQLRALLAFETDRALAWLNAGAPLAATLSGWPRLAVSGYLAGGRAAAARLRAHGYDPLPTPPKPRARDIALAWATAKLKYAG